MPSDFLSPNIDLTSELIKIILNMPVQFKDNIASHRAAKNKKDADKLISIRFVRTKGLMQALVLRLCVGCLHYEITSIWYR